MHEGIALTRRTTRGCERWPKHLRLASSAGRLVLGRCRATNLCPYCQRLYTIETVEALTLDALGGDAPTSWVVLTAREHLTRPEFNERFRMVRQRLRRRGWRWEYFCQVEFQKRGALHVNLLVKYRGGPGSEAELVDGVHEEWCSRVDAEPVGQWAEECGSAGAVTRYVSKELAHGLKQEQKPPIGWKGHRTSHSRGYFGRPMWKVRAEAKTSLGFKRALYRAEREGYSAAEAHAIAGARVLRAEQERYELVVVTVDRNGEPERVRPAAGGGVRTAMRSASPGGRRLDRELNYGAALRALDDGAGELDLAVAGSDPVPQSPPPAPLFTISGPRERFD